ncbi:hypothetical protein [Chengkuizengella marina]|uniref:Carboxypeptidase regulatory-like domain-containing protein n=1 Tax=Chengkuizengella marina TaxID=2507566 RepID=A0A6N9Q3C2_9BACL|nr:hypothetical protein [Chengkuizengella marina]NBI29280.1 hypothetical protein [Chengkuizengella marina]
MRYRSLLLTLGFIFLFMLSATVMAHDNNDHGRSIDHHAEVGKLYSFEGKLETTENGPFEIRFHAIRLEDDAQIITMKNTSEDGSYQFAAQFFDGAEHDVTFSLLNPVTEEVIMEKTELVEVLGFDPPMFIKIKTIFFLVMMIVIGMLLGVGVIKLRSRYATKGGANHGI